jgi:hypothetical protein
LLLILLCLCFGRWCRKLHPKVKQEKDQPHADHCLNLVLFLFHVYVLPEMARKSSTKSAGISQLSEEYANNADQYHARQPFNRS